MDKPVLSPSFKKELAADNPFSEPISMNDVQAWWDIAWLTYKTYGYRNHKRAIRRWWARARIEELHRARDRKREIELHRLQQKQDQLKPRTSTLPMNAAALDRVFGRKT